MKEIGEDIKEHVAEVLEEWERLVRGQPWYSLPAEHRVNNLPNVLRALAHAALCAPGDAAARRRKVEEAASHGNHRRMQGIPESLILTEYHLLRLAIWNYLVRAHGASELTAGAIMRIDGAITLATNASMWGYHRPEIEGLGKWQDGVEKMIASAAPLHESE